MPVSFSWLFCIIEPQTADQPLSHSEKPEFGNRIISSDNLYAWHWKKSFFTSHQTKELINNEKRGIHKCCQHTDTSQENQISWQGLFFCNYIFKKPNQILIFSNKQLFFVLLKRKKTLFKTQQVAKHLPFMFRSFVCCLHDKLVFCSTLVLYKKHVHGELTGRDGSLSRIVKQSWFRDLGKPHKEWTTTHRRVQETDHKCRVPNIQPFLNLRTTSGASRLDWKEREQGPLVVQSLLFWWRLLPPYVIF